MKPRNYGNYVECGLTINAAVALTTFEQLLCVLGATLNIQNVA